MLGFVAALAALIALFVLGQFLNLYIRARISGCRIGLVTMLGMRPRRADIRGIVLGHIRTRPAGLDVPIRSMAAHDRAGGRAKSAVTRMPAAREQGRHLSWEQACAQDFEDLAAAAPPR